MKTDSSERILYLDVIRVVAVFCVIIIHVVAQIWNAVPIDSVEFDILNVYDSIVRWSVPAYVMISGALFLNKKRDIKVIYSKNILRMVIAFLVWSTIYALVTCRGIDLYTLIITILGGHFHMWFILMLIGLYMMLPILQQISSDLRIVRYILVLAFIFNSILPWLIKSMYYFGNQPIISFANVLNSDFIFMNVSVVAGYIGYFFAGYYISNIEIKKSVRYIIYILGIVGFVMTFFLTKWYCNSIGIASVEYYSDSAPNVCLSTIAMFVLFKYSFRNLKENKVTSYLGKASFGAYLVHALIIYGAEKCLTLTGISFSPVASVPFVAVITWILSFAIASILLKIPVVNKYVV